MKHHRFDNSFTAAIIGMAAIALLVLALAMAPSTPARAEGMNFAALCQQYPKGVRRTGCVRQFSRQFGLIRKMQRHVHASPEKIARIVTVVSLQSVLALDTTVRYWNRLGQWAWATAAYRPGFHTFASPPGGETRAPEIMSCPGGGTIGIIDNGGGLETIRQSHSLPNVSVGFEHGCRPSKSSDTVTAVTPKAPYATSFSVPERIKNQLVTHPMVVLFNSQPRLSSMPAWIPSGPLGEIRDQSGRIRVYADTRKQNWETFFSFIAWPKHAHFVNHKGYASFGYRVAPSTPGVGAAHCNAEATRCLMLDTGAAVSDDVVAHYDLLAGAGQSFKEDPPPRLHAFKIGLNTTKPLAFAHTPKGPRLTAGQLTLHVALPAAGKPKLQPHWRITVEPRVIKGRRMLAVAWQHNDQGKTEKGHFTIAQAGNVSLPHYCGAKEQGWDCVDPAWYPDYAQKIPAKRPPPAGPSRHPENSRP